MKYIFQKLLEIRFIILYIINYSLYYELLFENDLNNI